MSNQMLDSFEGYLENIAAAATKTTANGGPMAELAASLAVSVYTVARQQLEIKSITEHINTLKKKGGSVTAGVTGTGGNNSPQYKHCAAVGGYSITTENQRTPHMGSSHQKIIH